jgi:DNA integrity scanning protein DisA with diadenylate cyclase activity
LLAEAEAVGSSEKMDVPQALAEAAIRVASDVNADAILVQTQTGFNCSWLLDRLEVTQGKPIKLIVATSNNSCFMNLSLKHPAIKLVKVPAWRAGRMAKLGQVVAYSLQQGYVSEGQRLVCLLGDGCPDFTDLIKVWDVTGEEHITKVFSNPILTKTLELSIEMATGGVDGKPVGAAFIIGDTKRVLRFSHQLMINPFEKHHVNVKDGDQWEMIKKYAVLDGAFVVNLEGVIVAAHRHLSANRRCEIPKGLGTRHNAVASMTAATASKGVTISQEDGCIRVFENGQLVAKVNPSSHVVECFKDPS